MFEENLSRIWHTDEYYFWAKFSVHFIKMGAFLGQNFLYISVKWVHFFQTKMSVHMVTIFSRA